MTLILDETLQRLNSPRQDGPPPGLTAFTKVFHHSEVLTL